MISISSINALAFASVLTAGATLRFRMWKRPGWMVLYFSFFLSIELVVHTYVIPEIAFGIELAYVCFSLTVALVLVIVGLDRYEKMLLRQERAAAESSEPKS